MKLALMLSVLSMLTIVAGVSLFVTTNSASAHDEIPAVAVAVADDSAYCAMVDDTEILGVGEITVAGYVDYDDPGSETQLYGRPSNPNGDNCRLYKRCTKTCYRAIDQAGNYTEVCTPWRCRYVVRCS